MRQALLPRDVNASLLLPLRYFSWARLLMACLLGGWFFWSQGSGMNAVPVAKWNVLQMTGMTYALMSAIGVVVMLKSQEHIKIQASAQIAIDLVLIGVMLFAAGRHGMSLAPVLLFPIAGSAILLPRLWSIAIAAMASLIVQSYSLWSVLSLSLENNLFVQAGVHGLIYFGTAFTVSYLALRTLRQESIAAVQASRIKHQQHINRMIINEMEMGVAIISPDGLLNEVNPAAQKFLGITTHKTGQLEVPPLVLLSAFQVWLADANQDTPVIMLQHVDQPALRLQVRFLSTDDSQRSASETIILLESLLRTEYRAQELKLASMGRLTASIAHEIRNPLSAIRHASALLREEIAPDALEQKFCKIIELNSQRINNIVEDILALSRKGPVNRVHVNVNAFLQVFQEEINPESGTRLYLNNLLKQATFILVDENHLRQILVNLTNNALRYASGQTSSVMIFVEEEHGFLKIAVSDDGPGIAADKIPNLFEPFFTTEQKGLGLGLYLARELASANEITLTYIESPSWHAKAKGAFELKMQVNQELNV